MGEALEVHGDVDFQRARLRGDVVIRFGGYFVKLVEGLDQARAHVVLHVGKGDDLEAGAVVFFEQLRHEIGSGVAVQVGGEITEADALVAVSFAHP